MQASNTRTARLAKKPKLANNNTLPIDGPFMEPAADGSASVIPAEPLTEVPSEHSSEMPTNTSAADAYTTSEPIINKSSSSYLDAAEALDSFSTDGLQISARIYTLKEIKQYNILNELFGQPAIVPGPYLPSTGINVVSSKASDIVDPDLSIASAAASESNSSGLSEPGSRSTDLTSNMTSETYVYRDLASGV
ncbi:hypothetical protein BGZ60DRAFT_437770 [Tricladium varicosporioides]|nr:hypothetical protein BGZ60DRAFT_437770 [Hymenoscyphus varicosporioides]